MSFLANSSAASESWLSATIRFTNPKRCASSAEKTSPVSSISRAWCGCTTRVNATIGVEQNSPILTPGVQNPADRAAITMSQLAASCSPAALARPCTSAMTGFGKSTIDCMSCEQRAMIEAK